MDDSRAIDKSRRIAAAQLARDRAAFAGKCVRKKCSNQAVAVAVAVAKRNAPPSGVCNACIPVYEARGYQIRHQPLTAEALLGDMLPVDEGWDGLPQAKRCCQCKERKPLSEFSRRGVSLDLLGGRCRECDRAKFREWTEANPVRRRESGRRSRLRRRLTVIQRYGGLCACCGEDRLPFLAIDHVDGGGSAHRRALKLAGQAFYAWLVQQGFPEGFRVLCHNCNQALGFYGACPHQEDVLWALQEEGPEILPSDAPQDPLFTLGDTA